MGILGSAYLSFFILGYVARYVNDVIDHRETKKGGFLTVEEYKMAKSINIKTKEELENYKKEQEIKIKEQSVKLAEQQRIAIEQKRQKEEAEKKKKEMEQINKAIAEGNCRQDLKCLAEKNFASATVYCSSNIEKLAKYDFKWTDSGWLETKFSHYRWKDKDSGIITYIGDKAMFQNGFGAWQAHIYECDFDTKNEKTLNVRARPGRL